MRLLFQCSEMASSNPNRVGSSVTDVRYSSYDDDMAEMSLGDGGASIAALHSTNSEKVREADVNKSNPLLPICKLVPYIPTAK